MNDTFIIHAENIPHAQPMIRTRIAARGEHSARAANDPHAYCSTRRTFRTRSGARTVIVSSFESPFAVATRGGFSAGGEGGEGKRKDTNIPHAQPNICTRIAARGEHSAFAANDPHAYCGTRGTFRTRSQ